MSKGDQLRKVFEDAGYKNVAVSGKNNSHRPGFWLVTYVSRNGFEARTFKTVAEGEAYLRFVVSDRGIKMSRQDQLDLISRFPRVFKDAFGGIMIRPGSIGGRV